MFPQTPLPTSSADLPAAAREKQFFDALVTSAGDFNPFAKRGWRTLARCFDNCVDSARGLDLLDVGCGTGQSRQIYRSHASTYTAIDLSARSLRIARSRHPDSLWIEADACAMPFANDSFDVVAFSSVLHHIPDYRPALREAVRVLKPGGRVFAFDPNLLHPAMALFRYPRSPMYLSSGVSPNERPLLASKLRSDFAESGLVDVRAQGQSDIPYRAVAPRFLNACLSFYNAADWLLERSGTGRWFGTFIVTTARKGAA